MLFGFHFGNCGRSILIGLGILIFSCVLTESDLCAQLAVPANSRIKIDSATAAGRFIEKPNVQTKNLGASLIVGGEILSCPLQAGETTFIISLPKASSLDHLTFVNENAEAKGEMKIAISNSRLPANSPKWIEVSGTTAFSHKRRFDLSMVGVEARYLRLSFRVEKKERVASTMQSDDGAENVTSSES